MNKLSIIVLFCNIKNGIITIDKNMITNIRRVTYEN